MKKCPGCQRELDKYTIACEYCGRLLKAFLTPQDHAPQKPPTKNEKKKNNS